MAQFTLGFEGEYWHETLDMLVIPVINTGVVILVDQWADKSEYQLFTSKGIVTCDCQLMAMATIMDLMQKKEQANANL